MCMTLVEANELQKQIAATHPLLDISIKKVGQEHTNEWVCFVDATGYYLWDMQDWLDYRDTFIQRLEIFTNEGKAKAQAKWRASRAATKANKLKQAVLSA